MTKKPFLGSDDQFIVSYELLYILQWLLTYEQDAFAKLVQKSFVKGSQATNNSQQDYDQTEESEYLQNSVVDFFSFLEQEVAKASNQESIQHILQKNLLQTLDHIDPTIFDPAIVQSSMIMTAEKIHPQKNHQAKDFFLKELLKQWHPKKGMNKKHTLN